MGSVRAARQAGATVAAAAVSANTKAADANVTTSNGCTPYNMVASERPKAAANANPMIAPAAITRAALRTTSVSKSVRVAPSARRTPNSRRRC